MLNKFIDLERLATFFQGLKDIFLLKSEASTTYATKSEVNNKVDKVEGKQLSTNDYTTIEKNKLAGIETGAEANTITSVQGRTGAVTISKSDVGLGSVNNVAITQAQVTKINELNYTRAMTEAQYNALTTTEKNRTDVWYGIYKE